MTKAEIMRLSTSAEMLRMMLKHPEAVDKDVSDQQAEKARQEYAAEHPEAGEYLEVMEDPPGRGSK